MQAAPRMIMIDLVIFKSTKMNLKKRERARTLNCNQKPEISNLNLFRNKLKLIL